MPRTEAEIVAAEEEQYQALWRHRDAILALRNERGTVGEPLDDHELGIVEGKLQTLRWVLGDDWGNLDT